MNVATHLTLNEREQRVKKTGDPVARMRFLAVYHATQGLTATAIATITVHSTRWVQQVVRRYNQEGSEALKDRRHTTPGQRPTLTAEKQQRVFEALQGPPPDGGWWTGPTLRAWVAPTETGSSARALARETVAVALGRIVGYRRLSNLSEGTVGSGSAHSGVV